MTGGFSNIKVSMQAPVARVVLCRPEKLNPIDWATFEELLTAARQIELDSAVSVVVITGEGRSFSAGGDVDKFMTLYKDPIRFRHYVEDVNRLYSFIEGSTKIYVVALNGLCIAAGVELLLACDIVIAADTARLGDGHLNTGQLHGGGGSQRLARSIGHLRAKHFGLTGDFLTAEEARQAGLVNEVVPGHELAAAVDRMVARLTVKSPAALGAAKYLLNQAARLDLEAGLALERKVVHEYATTAADAMEGLAAFREGRLPRFTRA